MRRGWSQANDVESSRRRVFRTMRCSVADKPNDRVRRRESATAGVKKLDQREGKREEEAVDRRMLSFPAMSSVKGKYRMHCANDAMCAPILAHRTKTDAILAGGDACDNNHVSASGRLFGVESPLEAHTRSFEPPPTHPVEVPLLFVRLNFPREQ